MADKTVSYTYSTASLVTRGYTITRDTQTIKANGSRTEDLKCNTVMGYDVATQKWTPFISTAVDGTAHHVGIYAGPDIPFADIVAGDVTGVDIIVGGDAIAVIREDQIVFEPQWMIDNIFGNE